MKNTFHLFGRLPEEIRRMIWQNAMHPVIVDTVEPGKSSWADYSVFLQGGKVATPMSTLSRVSREARSEVEFVHDATARWCAEGAGGNKVAWINFDTDVVKVHNMRIPLGLTPDDVFLFPECPIRKLLTVDFSLDPMPETMATELIFSGVNVGHLDLAMFPQLQEVTFASLFSNQWGRYGHPEIQKSDLHHGEQAKHSTDDSSLDAPMTWRRQVRLTHCDIYGVQGPPSDKVNEALTDCHGMFQVINMIELMKSSNIGQDDPEDLNVSSMGYTKTPGLYGAEWADFRYYMADGKVEFTPLAWHEVEAATYSCQDDYRKLTSVAVTDATRNLHFPLAVAKVFIVRTGEEPAPAEPHHCWVEVPNYSGSMSRAQRVMREMWNALASKFEKGVWTAECTITPKQAPR
ncbi:hypothetical protein HJFPF1_04842 [Paramyrothecium foliicola]|nr:hypothetical protein HJFPF1_04842 [Paramyrothecium foliicola]